MHERVAADDLGFVHGGVAVSSFGAPMAPEPMRFRENQQNEAMGTDRLSSSSSSRRGHSISFSGAAEELTGEPVAVFLLRGRPGSASGSTLLPGLREARAPFHEQEGKVSGVKLCCVSRILIFCSCPPAVDRDEGRWISPCRK